MRFTNKYAEMWKAHRIVPQNGSVANAWTDCTTLTEVADETVGHCAVLNGDGKTVDILKNGLYMFGGCLHVQNNTAGLFAGVTVLSRLWKNGATELRCSQRGYMIDLLASGERAISYNGTARFVRGDSVKLQYYTDNVNLDFDSNANFANQIAYTLWLVRVGGG